MFCNRENKTDIPSHSKAAQIFYTGSKNISFEELFDHEMTFQVVLNWRNECNTSCKEHQTTKTFKQWTQRLSDVALFISETFSHASKQ